MITIVSSDDTVAHATEDDGDDDMKMMMIMMIMIAMQLTAIVMTSTCRQFCY